MIVAWKIFLHSMFKLTKRFASSGAAIAKTALYDLHVSKGGKMVEFAGYYLPVQYEGLGVLKEHLLTRAPNSATLFDVSHMGQIKWYGHDAVKFIEKMVVGDIASLKSGEAKLSLIMNERGGIVDDNVITNYGNHIYMVVNGACKYKDMYKYTLQYIPSLFFFMTYLLLLPYQCRDHFNHYLKESKLDVRMEYLETQQLVALQGKAAATVLKRLIPSINFDKMSFMSGVETSIAGITNCRVTRCGYTGEDGFEISVPESSAVTLTNMLLDAPEVKPAGLGARDSLRLEAGLCLYGNDITDDINPVEANLVWTIGGPKSRRRTEQGFLGAEHILEKGGKLKPVTRKRVGIAGMKAPARGHTDIVTEDGGKKIGEITSGGFGPSFNKPMAMVRP